MIAWLVVGGLFPLSLLWWAAPRVYVLADRRLARRRLAPVPGGSSQTLTTVASPAEPANPTTTAVGPVELASVCDSIARALRSGRGAAESLIEAVDRLDSPPPSLLAVRSRLAAGEPLAGVLSAARTTARTDSDELLFLDLLSASTVGTSLVAGGIEHAATTLRDLAAVRSDLDVASAQARLSARVLTLLPLAVVAGGLLTSHSFRASLTSRGVLVPLVIGLVLTRVGWLWIVRMLDSAIAGASRFELAEIVDRVCVSLMAGCTLPEACERLGEHRPDAATHGAPSSTGPAIAARIREGRSMGDALEPLSTAFGLTGRLFADLLVSAERDGLPVVASVSRVAQDVRTERRRRVDAAIRRIPVRLTVPLVACILPGFLLTTLVPLVAASLDTLTVTLPDVFSPLGS